MTDEPTPTDPHPTDAPSPPPGLDVNDVARVDDRGPAPRFADRPWKYEWQGPFLDALSVMPVVASAARQAGVSRQWAYNIARIEPDFAEAWEQAYIQGVEVLEQHVHRWATVGIPFRETRTVTKADGTQEIAVTDRNDVNPQVAMFALRRHKPEYRDSTRVEHTGQGGGPVVLEVNRVPSHERLLALAQLARDLELPAYGVPPVIDPVPE